MIEVNPIILPSWVGNKAVFQQNVPFVIEGTGIKQEVPSMPGVYQYSLDRLHEEMDEVAKFPFEANHHDISIGSFMYVAYKTNLLQRYYPLFHEHVYYDDSILFVAPIMCAQTWVAYDIVVYNYLLGREGQTMDPNVLRRNVSYRIDAQDYMNSFCQRFDKDAMNAGVREWIAFVLGKHASYIFPYVVSLPYGKAKVESRKLFSAILQVEKELPSTKMLYRYKKLPFFMFYVLEKIRASKLNTKL